MTWEPAPSSAQHIAVLAIAIWAVVSGVWLRLPYHRIGPHGIADERAFSRRVRHRPSLRSDDDENSQA